MRLNVQPVRVDASEEGDGLLVFDEERLVAVLVRLSELHEDDAGKWYLEAGFGKLHTTINPVFAHLEVALEYIGFHLGHFKEGGQDLLAADG